MSQKTKKNLIIKPREKEILALFEFEKFYSISEIKELHSEETSLATLKRDIQNLKDAGFLAISGEKRGAQIS